MLQGMQKVRGSNPLSSTPGQRPVRIIEPAFSVACTAAKYGSKIQQQVPAMFQFGQSQPDDASA